MDLLTATCQTGERLRTRTVSAIVRSTVVDIPIPPPRVLSDWQREITLQRCLDPGDIEPLPLPRTRLRWPDLPRCFDAVDRWLVTLEMSDVLASCDVALMASRGTPYHHDGATYASKVFCNLFLSGDTETDFHFPAASQRIALVRGTVVVFDPCQPHAIIKRGAPGFDDADFATGQIGPQVFLTWELPVECETVRRALGITFDSVPAASPRPQGEQVMRNGEPVRLCPNTGGWLGHT